MTGKANSVHDFAEQIGKKLAAAELIGAEGDVEGSIKLMEEVSRNDGILNIHPNHDELPKVEDIRKNKAEAEQDYRNSMPASSYQQQKLRVCEVTFQTNTSKKWLGKEPVTVHCSVGSLKLRTIMERF